MSDRTPQRRDQRLHVMLTQDELRQIDDVRFSRRSESRADAVRMLIAAGLEATATMDPAHGSAS